MLGHTVLHHAAISGHLALVCCLVEQEKLNHRSSSVFLFKKTILNCAVWVGDLALTRYSVGQGSDFNALDKYDMAPLYLAVFKKSGMLLLT